MGNIGSAPLPTFDKQLPLVTRPDMLVRQALFLACLAFVAGVSRKRRRLAGGGEWTEWSSVEESWDGEDEKPEKPKDWGSDKDLEEEQEDEEEAWRDVRQLEEADILAVLSELINEELADEDERREEKKKTNIEASIDVVKAKKRRKGGRKRKKEITEEQIKREEEAWRDVRQLEEADIL